jgi:tetratricopeptide (TPR) repeat protein
MQRVRCLVALVVVLASLACASRRTSPQLLAEKGNADVLLREGCYRCLQDALATYERLMSTPRAPAEARRGAFDAALLLSMRAKELGLNPDPYLMRARTLASELTPNAVQPIPPAGYLEAADLFVGELSGLDPDVRLDRAMSLRRAMAAGAESPAARARLALAASPDLVADYLALAIDCEDPRARKAIAPDDVLTRHGAAPLIRYRLLLCQVDPATPASLREGDPRWVDTLFFEGRRELGRRPAADVAKAAELFQDARDAFPESTAIALALGNAQNALSEYESALASFDAVLRARPLHRDALLGRVMSLSYLSRHQEAIASATRMIELGTWNIGDAYYWRAWNRYHVYDLEAAWRDIEDGSKLNVDTSVFTLAGIIAYARTELATAIDRFDRAFALDNTNCEAVWTAGLVHVDQQEWQPAAPKFSRAATCFAAAAAQAQRDIVEIRTATYAEVLKTRRLAAAQKRVDTSEHRKAQAAFNAAQCYLRLGQKNEAMSHADIATEHPLLKEKAIGLKMAIDKLPQ